MNDHSEIAAQVWGETDDGFMAPGSHGPPAEAARMDLALALRDSAADLKCMEALARAEPDDDATFDLMNEILIRDLQRASCALVRFRSIRECTGEG